MAGMSKLFPFTADIYPMASNVKVLLIALTVLFYTTNMSKRDLFIH